MRLTHWRPVDVAFMAILMVASPAFAQTAGRSGSLPPADVPSFADLVDLSDSAPLVVHAKLRKLIRVENERAPGLRPGWGRFYARAQTQALLTGGAPIGEALTYLVDMRLDARGKPTIDKKQDVLLFARTVTGRPGELQLVAPDGQIAWSEETSARLRSILSGLVAPDAPSRVTGVRELIYVPGTLEGEGETQIFLKTGDGSAASITVRHTPGKPPAWGVSFSELVADVGNPPARDTLGWYRLACFLPNAFPARANLSETPAARRQAEADYRMVLGELGVCRRNRG